MENKSTETDRQNLEKIQEMMKNLPKGCLATIIKHSLNLLKIEDFVTFGELDKLTDGDPELK
jgi:hypothetical protein